MKFLLLYLQFLYVYRTFSSDPEIEEDELRAQNFMEIINTRDLLLNNKMVTARWNYVSNLTKENLEQKLRVAAEDRKYRKEIWSEINKYNWKVFDDDDLKRKFEKYSLQDYAALSEEKYNRLQTILSSMESIYSKSKICDYNNKEKCDLSLNPEIEDLLANSRDPEELKHVWLEWRKKTGVLRNLFQEYVDLVNEMARLNNFTDYTEYWLEEFETSDFREQMEKIWEQVQPLYLQLHAYVRYQLKKIYGEVVAEKGPIPAHLLGNMWAQVWDSLIDITQPFSNKTSFDVTSEMIEQNYTAVKIFELAEEFFVSLNLSAMPPLFWERSILEKPSDGRELVCHPSAWDFFDGKDFRIKQCTKVNMEHLQLAHHEMGHIQYFLQYKNQPALYRQGANGAFQEAVGDLMFLSISTTKHLKKIGLLPLDLQEDPENSLNNLLQSALRVIPSLPFTYLLDLWRWDVFKGKISSKDYNCKWWELRENYQGLEPPTERSEEDFDPSGKYHVVSNHRYIIFFVSKIIQFQFHKALCIKAGEFDPYNSTTKLHECDIYGSTDAGNVLGNMLQMGSSRPWPDAMEAITGQRNIDASALLEYFDPLYKWLKAENKKNEVFIGWEKSTKNCTMKRQEKKLPKDETE